MFKNCSRSVCPTSSTGNEPDPKKVSVLRHSTSDKSTGNCIPTQGTNHWLKNGGVLPLVCVDPTSNNKPTSSKNVRQSASIVKSATASNERSKPQAKHHSGRISSIVEHYHTQASLQDIDSKQGKVHKGDEPLVVFDKENFTNIIVSHFNEQSNTYDYNPDEFSEIKNKASASSPNAKRTLQASTTPLEKNHYDEKAKAEILLSIREELRSWKCEEALSDQKVLGE